MMRLARWRSTLGVWLLASSAIVAAQETGTQDALRAAVREALHTLTEPLVRDVDAFRWQVCGEFTGAADPLAPRVADADRKQEPIALELVRAGDERFVLRAKSHWASFELDRDSERTVLLLRDKGIAFVGRGALEPDADTLAPAGFLVRMLGARANAAGLLRPWLLARLGQCTADSSRQRLLVDRDTALTLAEGRLVLGSQDRRGFVEGLRRVEIECDDEPAAPAALALDGVRTIEVDRAELERMVFRAARRLAETWVPGLAPAAIERPARVDGGELRFVDGHRVVLLGGTPAAIGKAHGELLGELVQRTVDSCLYLVGFVETVREAKWFPGQLEDAWRRLSPHVPPAHQVELDAIADAVPGLTRRELRLASVFPEYFHCSGFAVFGKATRDGVLYHGRVLDYMTMIGLQHAAVTFVVRPSGGFGFLNVGYAGFTGSVTGMNERQISLGEMGGGGRYAWDGVPMATLMRRALEECSTRAEVEALWRESPRTCEYYYVFADGKDRSAVAVHATPEDVEFLRPGQAHPQLGAGIEDVVVLSAGGRLRTLRERIESQWGRIDADAALRLMDRPVAMSSNLHNALMVPETGVAWIAHAGASEPAAAMPYVRIELPPLLAELEAAVPVRDLLARDTLAARPDADPDAEALLKELRWTPAPFPVTVAPRADGDDGAWSAIATFPSPKPAGDPRGDRVVMEWYAARGRAAHEVAPAVVVLHILDGRMRVARTIAQGLRNHGIHAFVMHMPHYGQRAHGQDRRDARVWLSSVHQAAADARRARDAVAALPGVAPASISIQGTSLGGFVGALAAGIDGGTDGGSDGGFDRAFLMLAGGDLPAMFRDGERDTAKLRRSLVAAGLDGDRLDAMLRSIDPARLAHRLDPTRTWLYSTRSDQVVPAANASALAGAARLDAEHHLWFSGDHYTGVIHLPAILAHMVGEIRAGRSRP